MTLEPDLAERLRAEADRLDVTHPSFARLARRGRRRGFVQTASKGLALMALVATSAGLGLVVTNRDAGLDEPTRGTRGITSGPGADEDEEALSRRGGQDSPTFGFVPELAPAPAPQTDSTNLSDLIGEAGGSGSGDGSVAQQGSPGAGLPAVQPDAHLSVTIFGPDGSLTSPRVIKTARLRIEVGEDSLGATFAEVERLAGRNGGFVSDSFTRSNPARSGELTIRVPAAVFESVVADLKSLGRVESQRLSGVDVTADFVDLAARLRNWEAQERVLARLMGEANTINESLQVQRELQGVRIEIERIQGQLRVLRDQTDLASISIAIHEPGDAEEPSEDDGAWDRALSAAGNVLEAMLVGLGYLLPILAALIVLWLIARAARSRRTV